MVLFEREAASEPLLSEAALQQLGVRLRGELILPHEPGYDAARRVFNAMIDRRPAAIARCADTGDVVAAVTFGRDQGVPISVRGGGHGVAGHCVCDDGL